MCFIAPHSGSKKNHNLTTTTNRPHATKCVEEKLYTVVISPHATRTFPLSPFAPFSVRSSAAVTAATAIGSTCTPKSFALPSTAGASKQ